MHPFAPNEYVLQSASPLSYVSYAYERREGPGGGGGGAERMRGGRQKEGEKGNIKRNRERGKRWLSSCT